jgi:hypothetical protein
MARCVLSMIVDTDNQNAYILACMVHTHYAPCPLDGEPACPTPLHGWTERDPVRMWEERTGRQRSLLIHNGDVLDPVEHEVGEGLACWCRPEVHSGEPS